MFYSSAHIVKQMEVGPAFFHTYKLAVLAFDPENLEVGIMKSTFRVANVFLNRQTIKGIVNEEFRDNRDWSSNCKISS